MYSANINFLLWQISIKKLIIMQVKIIFPNIYMYNSFERQYSNCLINFSQYLCDCWVRVIVKFSLCKIASIINWTMSRSIASHKHLPAWESIHNHNNNNNEVERNISIFERVFEYIYVVTWLCTYLHYSAACCMANGLLYRKHISLHGKM